MSTDSKFLVVAGYILAMLIVFRATPWGAGLMLLALLAFVYIVTHED